MADATIGIAADVVLERCRATSQRLTHSATVSRESDRSAEGNRNILRVTTGLASLVTQACHSPAHLVRCEACWRTQSNGMPAVSQPGGAADSGRCVTTDPDRRMRLACWFGRKANVSKVYVLAVKTRLRTSPQGTKSLDILVAHCAALTKCIEPERDKFLFHPAYTHA